MTNNIMVLLLDKRMFVCLFFFAAQNSSAACSNINIPMGNGNNDVDEPYNIL